MANRPPIDLTIEGQGLKDLQRKLKLLDAKELRRELNKELRLAGRPLIAAARNAAAADLPRAGGLAARVERAPMRVSVTSSQREPGVKIVVKGVDARNTNRGRLRHPTYGHRDRWVTQQIKPGWFTDRMRRDAPLARPRIKAALDRVAAKVANG